MTRRLLPLMSLIANPMRSITVIYTGKETGRRSRLNSMEVGTARHTRTPKSRQTKTPRVISAALAANVYSGKSVDSRLCGCVMPSRGLRFTGSRKSPGVWRMNGRHGGPLPSDQQVGVRGASRGKLSGAGSKRGDKLGKAKQALGEERSGRRGRERQREDFCQEAPAPRARLLLKKKTLHDLASFPVGMGCSGLHLSQFKTLAALLKF
ncbi:hypothetical protein L345_06859, partial [Ophiophagus hannah]